MSTFTEEERTQYEMDTLKNYQPKRKYSFIRLRFTRRDACYLEVGTPQLILELAGSNRDAELEVVVQLLKK